MYCARTWMPAIALLTSSNASLHFVAVFAVCLFVVHRPCIYCSTLLVFLWTTSCAWSEYCAWNEPVARWNSPRITTSRVSCTLPLLDVAISLR